MHLIATNIVVLYQRENDEVFDLPFLKLCDTDVGDLTSTSTLIKKSYLDKLKRNKNHNGHNSNKYT